MNIRRLCRGTGTINEFLKYHHKGISHRCRLFPRLWKLIGDMPGEKENRNTA